ncbi:unknown similar to AMEV241 [Mythimna separata entomopoxvirus 'L']|uniref:Uncharacterized protein n=1 Tax=Mythimna separata entomopoxvirus 'L' TaxID=1293572 RepID=A0A916KQI9_9POXV|nr:unknown similar to AMEV241 [Mythimna separata entomopoxvirus 'L']CCU56464.1 unknown similar to AMEV241 [Mythimna separata entomopoxvirus 'L']
MTSKELIDNILQTLSYTSDESDTKLALTCTMDLLNNNFIKIIDQVVLKLLSERLDHNPLHCKDFNTRLDILCKEIKEIKDNKI